MVAIHLELETIAASFLYGSDSRNNPEWRAASFRGMLRYWTRAILGAESTALTDIFQHESNIFGSTGQGSAITLRLMVDVLETKKVPMLPHRQSGNPSKADAIAIGSSCRLSCSTRPAVEMPALFEQALTTWLLLGGIGKRSRRMFGAFQLRNTKSTNQNYRWLAQIESPQALQTAMQEYLGSILQPSAVGGIPSFPTLHPDHSHIIVGTIGSESAEALNQRLFRELLRKDYLAHQDYFGTAMGGRRASPLIAQVRKIGDEFYPILTYLRSSPELPKNRRADWKVVNRFMDDAKRLFKAETVWGGTFR